MSTSDPAGAIPIEAPDILGKGAGEIARVWINGQGVATVYIAAYALEDPFEFGRLIADTVRHGARAYAGTWSLEEDATLQRIIDGLVEELGDQITDLTTLQNGTLN